MPKNSKNNNTKQLVNSLRTQNTIFLSFGVGLFAVLITIVVLSFMSEDKPKPTPKPTPEPKKEVQYVWWNPRSWYHRRHRDRDDKQTVIIKHQYPTQAPAPPPTQAPAPPPTQAPAPSVTA